MLGVRVGVGVRSGPVVGGERWIAKVLRGMEGGDWTSLVQTMIRQAVEVVWERRTRLESILQDWSSLSGWGWRLDR